MGCHRFGRVLFSGRDSQLIDVRVKNAINKSDARRFVWVLIGEFDVDLPDAALEGCCEG